MYTPSLPPQRNETAPRTPHLHSPETTLSEHENEAFFQLYLKGRQSSYAQTIANATDALERAEKTQKTYKNNPHLWAYAEGQIEALKELIAHLEKLQKIVP